MVSQNPSRVQLKSPKPEVPKTSGRRTDSKNHELSEYRSLRRIRPMAKQNSDLELSPLTDPDRKGILKRPAPVEESAE